MYILGVTEPGSWNNAAALIKDGQLLAMAEEERFIRMKHSPNIIPERAVRYCLKHAGITLDEVDYIAVGWRDFKSSFLLGFLEELKQGRLKNLLYSLPAGFEHLLYQHRLKTRLNSLAGKKFPKWAFIAHHIAHAASCFRASGFNKASILTLDGNGEDDSGLLGIGMNREIRKLKKIELKDSVGFFYAEATGILGFKKHSAEGKTMGLAGCGEPEFSLKSIVKFYENNGYSFDKKYLNYLWRNFGPKRKKGAPIKKRHKDFAASVQNLTEKIGVHLAKALYAKSHIENFCLAGGVTLNCDMNAKILELPFVRNIFIQPAAHDAGCALGAALELYSRLGGKIDFVMKHAYWGSEYSNQEIEQILKESKINYNKIENIEEVTARLLTEGKIVGWFQGRMEVGPRALGNRSILAHPSLEYMKDKINREVKHREMWRPFAPSILEEDAPDYLEGYYPSPFMLLTFKVKEDKRKNLSQAMHVDDTARVQTVNKKTNPRFYKLIENFKRLTGIPAVLNTSFNDKGEPLVMSPKDALRTFYSTGMDVLVMGDFLIEKGKL